MERRKSSKEFQMKNLPKSQTEIKPNEYWSKMPLSAPLYIRCPNKLFIYGLLLFKIGNQGSWSGRINKIVEIANENTPLSQKRWTYARVDYILRWLRKEGWIKADRPARNKALVYSASKPTDVLPMEEPKTEVRIQSVSASVYVKRTEYDLDRDPESIRILEEFDAAIGHKFT